MSYSRELRELEEQGIDLVEILGQDTPMESPAALRAILERLRRAGDHLYSDLLQHLTQRRFDEEEAQRLWRGIMKHKRRLAASLSRDVAFRVAALDYLSTRTPVLRQVRLVARPEYDRLSSHVSTDEVTGVFNRRHFNTTLSDEIHRARRYGNSLSLLIVDVDDFKAVNDTLGHVEGDAVLRRLGRLLRDGTRQSDSVCRYGGDEFALLLPETDSAEAHALGERLRRTVRATLSNDATGGPLTVTMGGAAYPQSCDEAEELVAMSDQMCLDAKRAGKDRVVMSQGDVGI